MGVKLILDNLFEAKGKCLLSGTTPAEFVACSAEPCILQLFRSGRLSHTESSGERQWNGVG